MRRFENARVNDTVYSRLHGYGTITYIDKFILKCRFDMKNHKIDSEYLLDGRLFESDTEATLFYAYGTNNYLTERPEQVNWVEWEGKAIEVYVGADSWESRILLKYDPTKERRFICESYSDREKYSSWSYARLI